MSYPKRSLDIQPTRGIIYDTADQEVGPDYWTDGQNVQFRDGFAQRVLGNRDVYEDEIAAVGLPRFLHALNAITAATNYWLVMDASGEIYSIQPGTLTKIDGGLLSPVSAPWRWSSAFINGIPILNNTQDEPHYWPFSGDIAPLPGWTATESAGFVAVLKFHVFAMNISGPSGDFPNLVKWSAATEPGSVPSTWVPAPDNDAGAVELADSPGAIICAYPLGDSLLIYKRTAIYQARFGGANVFSFRKVSSSLGALTPRAVCDIGNGLHFVVTDGDIVLFDGTNARTIGESRVRDFLFENIDGDNFLNLFCVYNRSRDEVLLAYPSKESNGIPDKALVYDVSRDSFGVRDIPDTRHGFVGFINDTAPGNTWADRTETWEDAVGTWAQTVGSEATDSLVLVKEEALNEQDVLNSVSVNAKIARSGLTFGDPKRIKFVRQAHIRTRDPYGTFFVRAGASQTPNGAISWSDEVQINGEEQIVPLFAQGRYIAVEMRSGGANIWTVTGIELEAELRGYH